MLKGFILVSSGLFNLFFMTAAQACDDKACETAYLSESRQYINNHARRGIAAMQERHAYSKNRERKDYALYVHYFLMKYGDPTDKTSKIYLNTINNNVDIAGLKKQQSKT